MAVKYWYLVFSILELESFVRNLFALKLAGKVFSETRQIILTALQNKRMYRSICMLTNHYSDKRRNVRIDAIQRIQTPSENTLHELRVVWL